ncbi:MAG: tol-pal system protein YbgF [Deltaproteobacteria bacterium]|nr:tol-pal system protein YbgF [Candidatus Tharpella sp.]
MTTQNWFTVLLTTLFLTIVCGCAGNGQQQAIYQRLNTIERQQAALSRKSANAQQKLNADTNIRLDNLERELKLLGEAIEDNLARPEEIKTTSDFEFKTVIAGLEERLQKLENNSAATKIAGQAKTVIPTPQPQIKNTPKSPVPGAREKALYDDALATFKRGSIKSSKKKFKKFIASFPNSNFKINALFWIGECFYKEKDYAEAIIKYDEIIAKHPQHPKAASALLKQGFAFLQLGDATDGKLILEKVINNYPKSDQAEIARRKLKSID